MMYNGTTNTHAEFKVDNAKSAAGLKNVGENSSIPPNSKLSFRTVLIAGAIATTVFALDLMAPLGVAGGVPYIFLVLTGLWFPEKLAVLYLALISSILTILGYFFSPEGGIGWVVFTNRSYAIIAIWSAAIVIWWTWRKRQSQLHELTNVRRYFSPNTLPLTREYIFVVALISITIVSSWGVVSRIENGAKKDIGESLETVLRTSHVSIRQRLSDQKMTAIVWAESMVIKTAARELAYMQKDVVALISSQSQKTLREWIMPMFGNIGYRGYFIIGRDNINLASSRDKNIGLVNLLSKSEGFLDRIWYGETLVSLPQKSDIPLRDNTGEMIEGLATMFVTTPIKNEAGDITALLAFRLDPDDSFTPIFEHSRFGSSGETYAFNRDGLLISESRSNDDLRKMGLLTNNHSDLNIEIRDPGVNLALSKKSSIPRSQQPLTHMAQNATVGQRGSNLNGYNNYRGAPVAGAWLWDEELGFGIATEINIEEIFSSFRKTRFVIITFTALTIGLLIFLAMVSSRSRRRLVLSEAKYRSTIDTSAEGYIRVDTDGRVLELNAAFCRMLRRKPEEIIGRLETEFTSERVRAFHKQKISEISTTDQRHYELEFSDVQGESVQVNINSTTVQDLKGKVKGAFAFITDITERKKTDMALADKVKELDFQKFALDQHAIVSISDIKGNITYANDKFCTISEYTRDELIGVNHRILNSGEHSKEFFLELWKTIAKGKVWHGNIRNRKKGGGYYWVNATIVPFLNENGKPFQYVAIRTDITTRILATKEAEIAKGAAETANRAKSNFLSSMSHELRTPMNSIIGFGQLLESNSNEPLSKSQHKCVNHIMKSGRHLLELINEILDSSGIEAGRVKLSLETLDISTVIKECSPIITILAEKYGISINIPDISKTNIRADFTRVKQVLLNFMSNAIKYNREGGSVYLSVSQNMEHVRVSIRDTGEGIPEDRQNELFLPFSRLGYENKDIEGTGIGLSITKRLVELMEGSVGFESTHGVGSTFWVELPMATDCPTLTDITQEEDEPVKINSEINARILYVEDNPANLELMNMIVDRVDGLNLLSAHNGELGLILADSEQPDIIILDINLPGMDGFQVLDRLKGNERTKNIPTIALSANAMPRDLNLAKESGFLHYLTKPIDIYKVTSVIKQHVGNNTNKGEI